PRPPARAHLSRVGADEGPRTVLSRAHRPAGADVRLRRRAALLSLRARLPDAARGVDRSPRRRSRTLPEPDALPGPPGPCAHVPVAPVSLAVARGGGRCSHRAVTHDHEPLGPP